MKTGNPKVSVILPNYNHAPYLEQRINSILDQTYQNFELIILDDKSQDNSVDIINKYREHPKVSHIIVNNINSGSTFIQWNRGFHLAKGEIIWIAESDDFCEPTLLESLVEQFDNNPDCVVAYCSSVYVDSIGNILPTPQPYSKDIYHLKGDRFIHRRMALGCAIWNASSAIFRKDAALKINPQYQDYKACGDKLFWLELAELGDVVHVNKPLNYFRQHNQKVSPKRNLDGTSLKEEYRIFLYQVSKGYLNFSRKVDVLAFYEQRIRSWKFNNEEIRKELYLLWGLDNKAKCLLLRSYMKLKSVFNSVFHS